MRLCKVLKQGDDSLGCGCGWLRPGESKARSAEFWYIWSPGDRDLSILNVLSRAEKRQPFSEVEVVHPRLLHPEILAPGG